jgi:transposase-like protein
MSEIEIITDDGRRRHWTVADKPRIVEETLDDGASISVVARRNGVAPNLLCRWRCLMLTGGSVAVSEDDDVTANKVVRPLADRIRELERQLGRKTPEAEILREALDNSRSKTDLAHTIAAQGRFPVTTIARTLGVARSTLTYRSPRRPDTPALALSQSARRGPVPILTALVAERPTYGYRRITALINRKLKEDGAAPVNRKRVYRLMQVHNLLLTPAAAEWVDPVHDGKVIVMRSNLRWCSDGFEFACWNGDIVRGAFVIDAHDRDILA